jgi:ribosomal protein S6--L-glutamate ligase
MIVSFHPCFSGDKQIICAGRKPNLSDISAIKSARAVILPQGCSETLYRTARRFCRSVFPNYDARFDYPGKIGQIKLFQMHQVPHPETCFFSSVAEYHEKASAINNDGVPGYPFVFKYDWGGEGYTVFKVTAPPEFDRLLDEAHRYEQSGHCGFLIQRLVPCSGKTLRVVVIGNTLISYWRIQERPECFHSSVFAGARIDHDADPDRQSLGRSLTRRFCRFCGINLAGFDLLFSEKDPDSNPMLLEINYFFGRKGLGGSEPFYRLLTDEIVRWIEHLD